MDYLSQMRGILLAIGVVLPTVWIAWKVAWKIGSDASSPRESFAMLGEQRTVAYFSAWALITTAVLFFVQLLPN